MKIIPLFIPILVLVGCSNRGVYDGLQAGNRFECSKRPAAEYDECVKNTSKSYTEYEREKKEALGE